VISYAISSYLCILTLIAILDLQKVLASYCDTTPMKNPLDMPRKLILQFDNCAENKVSSSIYSFIIYYLRVTNISCIIVLTESIHVRLDFYACG
jgi:hypothetical protein